MKGLKKVLLAMAVCTILTGCGNGKGDTGTGTFVKDVVINTTVRTTGQYPENIVVKAESPIKGKFEASDFTMKGHADSWMNESLHDFSCEFEKVEVNGDTLILYPKDFPEKFFYVQDFTVECAKDSGLFFTYENVSKVNTPVADDFETFTREEGAGFDYHMFTPASEENMPVVVVFHGFSDTDNLLTYRTAVEWAEPENQAVRPCYVIAPIITDKLYYSDKGRADVFDQLKILLDKMIEEGKVDKNRIYVMGNSFGGMSSIEFTERYPDYVAGILALCPALNYSNGAVENIEKIKDTPIWIAQAVHDGTIPIEGNREAFAKLKAANPKEAMFKEYSDEEMNAAGGNPSNDSTYSYHHVELAVMEDDAYMEWLYSKTLN